MGAELTGIVAAAVAVIAGLIHLHVRVAVIHNDVRWVKAALEENGLLPQVKRGEHGRA